MVRELRSFFFGGGVFPLPSMQPMTDAVSLLLVLLLLLSFGAKQAFLWRFLSSLLLKIICVFLFRSDAFMRAS